MLCPVTKDNRRTVRNFALSIQRPSVDARTSRLISVLFFLHHSPPLPQSETLGGNKRTQSNKLHFVLSKLLKIPMKIKGYVTSSGITWGSLADVVLLNSSHDFAQLPLAPRKVFPHTLRCSASTANGLRGVPAPSMCTLPQNMLREMINTNQT